MLELKDWREKEWVCWGLGHVFPRVMGKLKYDSEEQYSFEEEFTKKFCRIEKKWESVTRHKSPDFNISSIIMCAESLQV